MAIVSDPGGQAVGGDYSFQEEEHPMETAGGEDCGCLSEEDGKEAENNLFEEEDDVEGARVSPKLEDAIRHIDNPHSPGNRQTEKTRLWEFELLRTCGSKAMIVVRGAFSLGSLSNASLRLSSIKLN
jgi:hypothetical protein